MSKLYWIENISNLKQTQKYTVSFQYFVFERKPRKLRGAENCTWYSVFIAFFFPSTNNTSIIMQKCNEEFRKTLLLCSICSEKKQLYKCEEDVSKDFYCSTCIPTRLLPHWKLAPDYREPTIGLETINTRQHRRKETDDGRAKKIVQHKS